MKTCLISCSCAGANVDLSRDESRWSQWMCYSEETGETGCPTIFLIFKSPRIFFFFLMLQCLQMCTQFSSFRIFLCYFISWSSIFHAFGRRLHYSKMSWACQVTGFCYKFEKLSKLPQICQFLDKLL